MRLRDDPNAPEHIGRAMLMASADPTWDLSPNDCAAIQHVLDRMRAAEARVAELDAELAACGRAGCPTAAAASPTVERLRDAAERADWREVDAVRHDLEDRAGDATPEERAIAAIDRERDELFGPRPNEAVPDEISDQAKYFAKARVYGAIDLCGVCHEVLYPGEERRTPLSAAKMGDGT